MFRSKFEDPKSAQDAFDQLFKNWHTDDYPQMFVSVRVDGEEFGVKSDSQRPFMLPWLGIDESRERYNCHISQAIAAVLPLKFTNRNRLLLDHGFRSDLASQIMHAIEPKWNLLDTEYKVGADVAPVFARFSPVESAMTCISSIDVDSCSWNAELRDPKLPTNLVIGVSLPYFKRHDGFHLVGVGQFLKQVSEYTNLVESVPWFQTYIGEHPETTVEVRFVGDRSLSPKAVMSFTEDLSKHGKAALANRVSKEALGSAFLEINGGSGRWSRLLIFPNREILLWHFQGESVLGFAQKDLESWDYLGWRSIGMLIDTNGRQEH